MVEKSIAKLKKLKPFSRREMEVIIGVYNDKPELLWRLSYKIRAKLIVLLDNIFPAFTNRRTINDEIISKVLKIAETALRTYGYGDLSEVVTHVHDEFMKRRVTRDEVD